MAIVAVCSFGLSRTNAAPSWLKSRSHEVIARTRSVTSGVAVDHLARVQGQLDVTSCYALEYEYRSKILRCSDVNALRVIVVRRRSCRYLASAPQYSIVHFHKIVCIYCNRVQHQSTIVIFYFAH